MRGNFDYMPYFVLVYLCWLKATDTGTYELSENTKSVPPFL